MRGFVFVGPGGTRQQSELESWIQLGLEFNRKAKKARR